MHRATYVGFLAAALAALASAPALAQGIDWGQVIGANPGKLSPQQKKRVADNLGRIDNTHGCQGTLAHCMSQGDLTARRHAGFVVRMVVKSKTDAFIADGISRRAASARPDETFEIDLANHPHMGNQGAEVVLVEYACFQCPYCSYLAPKLKKLKKQFGGKVVHYFKFFPVRSHEHGVHTALAGLAAYEQGKFWPLYDAMYANRSDLEREDVRGYAEEAGIDLERMEKDMADPSLMRYVEKDKLEGMRLGVEGTPTFFVNGKLYQGQNEYAEIADRIGEELDIIEGRIP